MITRGVINSNDIILCNITVTKIYNDSLDKRVRFATYWETSRWKSSYYKALVSQGVENIQSKELRESIIDLYEIYIQRSLGIRALRQSKHCPY